MRRVGQIWRLWSEELKPKWSAFTPTGWFKHIICHDWSNLAPPFLLLVREWQLKAEAWWRRGIGTNGTAETQTGQRTNAEYVALLTYCMMDLSLVKDDAVWTDTVSHPARGDGLVLRVREDLISNITLGKVWKPLRFQVYKWPLYFFFSLFLHTTLVL